MIKIFDPGVNGVKGTVYEIAPLAKKYGLDGIALLLQSCLERQQRAGS